MMFLRRIAVSILVSLVVCLAGAQPKTELGETLFTIRKKPVTAEEFIYLYRKNHQHKPEDFTKEKIEEYLNLFINYKLKVEEGLSRGMDTTSAFRKEYQTYRDELLKPYMPDSKVVDSLVLLTYDRLKEEVNVSHILIRLTPDASPDDTLQAYSKVMDIRKRALSGEDFGSLATEFSEEPGVEISKGNLGYFTAMQMVFPFEQAAYLTPVGGISDPVRTQFGYHIIKVHDRQPSRGEVEVSHIMIRSAEGADDTEEKNTIFEIYDKLQKGMDWSELCAQYSQDVNSKDQGGKLRPFGVGAMASVPKFQEMAFALQDPGDISDPVRTQFGWHILKLESKIPLPSFEELKASLTQRVSRDERVRISQAALRERMRREFGYEEQSLVKTALLANADSVLANPGSAHLQNQTLFTMSGQSYSVNDFLKFVEAEGKRQAGISSRQYLEQQFAQYVDRHQIRLLEEKVKRESPDYKWLLKEYYEGILLFEIMEKEVWNKAMEDSLGQLTYFRQHAADYKAGERMAGKIYSGSNKAHLERLKAMLDEEPGDIGEFISLNRIRTDSGAFEQKDRLYLSKITWAPGSYVVEQNNTAYLVKIDQILPPGPQTFEEARASVISDYQSFIEDSWIRELKRKFVVKVGKKAKKRAFAHLMDL